MIYDFKCAACKKTETVSWLASQYDDMQKPSCCGSSMGRIFNCAGIDMQSKGYFPQVFHDLGHEPVMINDAKHLQREMKARGLVAVRDRGISDRTRDKVRELTRTTVAMGSRRGR